jgi:RNA-directed DNA polymerase
MEMLQKRVVDKDLLRIIGKWLHIGVMEEGRYLDFENGVYQGSAISPILANLYLHVVLDEWVEHTVKPRMRGEISLFRFCDDFIVCFQYRDDAERFHRVLPKRFERFGLTLHPEKTRLIEFGRFAGDNARRKGQKPSTFKFLGFTFYGAKAYSGKFVVMLKTLPKRLGRKLNEVREYCRQHRHDPVWKQRMHLRAVLLGHYNYYGRTTNHRSLAKFSRGVERAWKFWLGRRGQKGRYTWTKFKQTLRRYPLTKPTITQNWRGKQLELPVR